jgi:hypothetical protein
VEGTTKKLMEKTIDVTFPKTKITIAKIREEERSEQFKKR